MTNRNPNAPSSFELLDQQDLPLWNGSGSVYRHASGAKVLSVENNDDNKTFGIFFPTPPTNHTGLPHILEHCVLCGSDKYPVKEPFKELLKTSLQTFLNAFTYPDKTCYPVASQNLKDFYNLVDVYMDAVFHPRLTPAVLGQEGWRLQRNEQTGDWELQGVVFNEMKGAYSSGDARLDTAVQKELYPENAYRWDYGGQPANIPELTFEEFLAFHQAHYHPANAWIAFYGNDDPLVRLEKVEEVLSGLEPGPVADLPALQPAWTSPRTHIDTYPASEGSDEGVFAQISWLLPGVTSDAYDMKVASLASTLLLNSPSSPLRLALLESGLGDDIIGGAGFDLRQPNFSAGLKGVEPGQEEEVFSCIRTCLEDLAENGFREDLVEGVLTLNEFRMREMNTANKGLWAIISAVQPWIYGGDPLEALHPEPHLERIREAVKENPSFFSDWVQEQLLNNPAQLLTTMSPDTEQAARERDAEAAYLEEQRIRLDADPSYLEQVETLANQVSVFQDTPDSEEDLAKLPSLHLPDVEPLPAPPPREIGDRNGVEVSTTRVDANGIVYFQFAFDFSQIPTEDLALLAVYSRCLTELGTTTKDQQVFNEQVACHTGGIQVQFETTPTYDGGELAVMMLKVKCLVSKTDKATELLSDLFQSPLLGPADKIRQMIAEERANEELNLQHSGHRTVSLRLKAGFSASERATEAMDGIHYVMALRDLEETDPEEILAKLQDLHLQVCTRSGVRAHVGGDSGGLEVGQKAMDTMLQSLPEGSPVQASSWDLYTDPRPEALLLASPVQYVGLITPMPESPATAHYSHFVARRLLDTDFLWERVRMQGGAYGCSSSYSTLNNLFVLTSYRDPQIDRTLDLYREGGLWLQKLSLSPDALEQAVIGTLGKLTPVELPSSLVSKSFFRHLIGLDFPTRERFYAEVAETTQAHIHAFGAALTEAMSREHRICVLGGPTAVDASSTDFRRLQVL